MWLILGTVWGGVTRNRVGVEWVCATAAVSKRVRLAGLCCEAKGEAERMVK